MNREQVREAVAKANDRWWKDAVVANNILLDDFVTNAVMRLDKPPTVTKTGIWGALDKAHEVSDDPSKSRFTRCIADYLTAQGVNVED
jgi:hypothetical protein